MQTGTIGSVSSRGQKKVKIYDWFRRVYGESDSVELRRVIDDHVADPEKWFQVIDYYAQRLSASANAAQGIAPCPLFPMDDTVCSQVYH